MIATFAGFVFSAFQLGRCALTGRMFYWHKDGSIELITWSQMPFQFAFGIILFSFIALYAGPKFLVTAAELRNALRLRF